MKRLAQLPTVHQKYFVDTVADLVNMILSTWPVKSGKTTARQLLAERILKDDKN